MPLQSLRLATHFVKGEIMSQGKFGLAFTCTTSELTIGESFFVADKLKLVLINNHNLPD